MDSERLGARDAGMMERREGRKGDDRDIETYKTHRMHHLLIFRNLIFRIFSLVRILAEFKETVSVGLNCAVHIVVDIEECNKIIGILYVDGNIVKRMY